MFGGINTPDNLFFNDFWVLNFAKLAYDQGNPELGGVEFIKSQTAGLAPSKRKGHVAFVYRRKMYVIGGATDLIEENTTDKIYLLDLGNMTMTEKSSFGRVSAAI